MIRCTHDDCIYQGQLGENVNYCNYIGHAGKRRGCDPAVCHKYIQKKVKGHNGSAMLNNCSEKSNTCSEETIAKEKGDIDDCENLSGFTG